MTDITIKWPTETICHRVNAIGIAGFADNAYRLACRTSFDSPGFCLINLGNELESVAFRQSMIDLVTAMSSIHHAKSGESLSLLSATRFDQQTSTKPHLDGGPAESFVVLGYEPSAVSSQLTIYDYSRCAYDHGMTPDELMTNHNPMFQAGVDFLNQYSTPLTCFSPFEFQIVCINNSRVPYTDENSSWLGTLHTAVVPSPDESQRRIINSTMVCPFRLAGDDALSDSAIKDFVHSSAVRRRGYDKTHLDDDA